MLDNDIIAQCESCEDEQTCCEDSNKSCTWQEEPCFFLGTRVFQCMPNVSCVGTFKTLTSYVPIMTFNEGACAYLGKQLTK